MRKFLIALFALLFTNAVAQNQIIPGNNFNWTAYPNIMASLAPNPNGTQNARDAFGFWIGGTEARNIIINWVPSGGVLYGTGVTIICSSSSPTWVSAQNACAEVLVGNGQWYDVPGPEGFQKAKILVLLCPSNNPFYQYAFPTAAVAGNTNGCNWLLDRGMSETITQNGARPANFAVVDDLKTHTFVKSCTSGAVNVFAPLAIGQSPTGTEYYIRNNMTGGWVAFNNTSGGSNQGRSIGFVLDTTANIDYAFMAEDVGIFRGCFQSSPFQITWNTTALNIYTGTTPTLCGTNPQTCTNNNADVAINGQSWSGAPQNSPCNLVVPCGLNLRFLAQTTCNDGSGNAHLFAAIGFEILEYVPSLPGFEIFGMYPGTNVGSNSASGIRGLSCIPAINGDTGQDLILTTEGANPFVYRVSIDGDNGLVTPGTFTFEYSLKAAYNLYCNVPNGTFNYRIDAYNGGAFIPINNSLVWGLGTTFAPSNGVGFPNCPVQLQSNSSIPAGNGAFTGQWGGIWITPNSLASVSMQFFPSPQNGYGNVYAYTIATRAMVLSPWANDPYLYACGTDMNYNPDHLREWCMKILTSSLNIQ